MEEVAVNFEEGRGEEREGGREGGGNDNKQNKRPTRCHNRQ